MMSACTGSFGNARGQLKDKWEHDPGAEESCVPAERFSDEQKNLIRDAIKTSLVNLCSTGISFSSRITVEGLLGITVDNTDILLVNINEVATKDSLSATQVSQRLSQGNVGTDFQTTGHMRQGGSMGKASKHKLPSNPSMIKTEPAAIEEASWSGSQPAKKRAKIQSSAVNASPVTKKHSTPAALGNPRLPPLDPFPPVGPSIPGMAGSGRGSMGGPRPGPPVQRSGPPAPRGPGPGPRLPRAAGNDHLIQRAIDLVLSKQMNASTVISLFGIARSTFYKKLKDVSDQLKDDKAQLMGMLEQHQGGGAGEERWEGEEQGFEEGGEEQGWEEEGEEGWGEGEYGGEDYVDGGEEYYDEGEGAV